MGGVALFRYNFRVLMANNWWLPVLPVAASQLTVFWNIITQPFTPALPARSVEMITPLLAAFLSAHLLSAEYQAGMGAILASKPVHIGRIVLRRLAVVMAVVWTLAALSLAAYWYGMEPYGVTSVAAAGAVSSLYLALLALTFATWLRSPLAGFGVAALVWALDLPPGPPMNPYLSLSTLSFALQPPDIASGAVLPGSWWAAKLVLLVATVVLYRAHGKLLFRLGSPFTVLERRRAVSAAGALLAFIVISGAGVKVAYGYAMRGSLEPDDTTWFRRQFAAYGPIPVAALFGGAFRSYVGPIPSTWRLQQQNEADRWGATAQRVRDLREVVDRMPRSVWAPSASEVLARIDPPSAEEHLRRVLERYPQSPLVPGALNRLARIYADDGRDDQARAAYLELLERRPRSRYRTEALRFLTADHHRRGEYDAAERWARDWIAAASVRERASAHMALADILHQSGRDADARAAAEQALRAVEEFDRAARDDALDIGLRAATRWKQEAARVREAANRLLGR
ncbi:MAG TPA: tetratricopeptide repeat protein [Chthonomonadales bacterium]|nr:tetratricopeptide repeat protein [Chthonomonadales bacterium]